MTYKILRTDKAEDQLRDIIFILRMTLGVKILPLNI